MIGVLLGIAALFGLTLLLTQFLIRRAAVQGSRYIESRFRAAECIVNEGRVPEAWVRTFYRRVDAIRRRGGTADSMEQEGQRLRKRCLRELDSLTRFFQGGTFVDSPATRDILIQSLQDERSRWAAEEWSPPMACGMNLQNAAYRPRRTRLSRDQETM
jgi:hypothetical protein